MRVRGRLGKVGVVGGQAEVEVLPVALREGSGRGERVAGLLVLLLLASLPRLPGLRSAGLGRVDWQVVEAAARDGDRKAAADGVGSGTGVALGPGDAAMGVDQPTPGIGARPRRRRGETWPCWDRVARGEEPGVRAALMGPAVRDEGEAECQPSLPSEIGRASCRERVSSPV